MISIVQHFVNPRFANHGSGNKHLAMMNPARPKPLRIVSKTSHYKGSSQGAPQSFIKVPQLEG